MKVEARDGFTVGAPNTKSPPALAYLAVSDVMCAFKQVGALASAGAGAEEQAGLAVCVRAWLSCILPPLPMSKRAKSAQLHAPWSLPWSREPHGRATHRPTYRPAPPRPCRRASRALCVRACVRAQATQHWPTVPASSPAYAAQQEVVQSFIQNVLRETRGPLTSGGADHSEYRCGPAVRGMRHATLKCGCDLRIAQGMQGNGGPCPVPGRVGQGEEGLRALAAWRPLQCCTVAWYGQRLCACHCATVLSPGVLRVDVAGRDQQRMPYLPCSADLRPSAANPSSNPPDPHVHVRPKPLHSSSPLPPPPLGRHSGTSAMWPAVCWAGRRP